MDMLRIRGLTKSYGHRVVLRDIDLDVPAGSVMLAIGFRPTVDSNRRSSRLSKHIRRVWGESGFFVRRVPAADLILLLPNCLLMISSVSK